ncbi:MAG: hypothetical protein ACREJ0_06240 [Geminicoccaceae bacterium]
MVDQKLKTSIAQMYDEIIFYEAIPWPDLSCLVEFLLGITKIILNYLRINWMTLSRLVALTAYGMASPAGKYQKAIGGTVAE